MRILIIGGVAGGASAATRARRLNEAAEITMVEQGPYVSYANCGLPYYVGGQIPDPQDLLLETPESLWDRFRIDVRVNTRALDIDLAHRQARIANATEQSEVIEFDRLILSPGASPVIPPIAGLDRPDVFMLRTVPDALNLRQYLDSHGNIRHITVIGAGFIGMEMAEVLHSRGYDVTVVDKAGHILPVFDPDIASYVEHRLSDLGIKQVLGTAIHRIDGALGSPTVTLDSQHQIRTDAVVVGLGVRPSLRLAQQMGLKLGSTGAIWVDPSMKTSHPLVYAAGDAVEKRDLVTGLPRWWPLAGIANKEGRVAGTNAAGGSQTFPGALGTAIVRVSPYYLAMTGLTETTAKQIGIDHQVLYTVRGHHASYYPGAEDLFTKVIYDPSSGRLLGAQIAGQEGVDKRIDIFATAIQGHLTMDSLESLDLAYAPPVGAAKDPVIITAMAAGNHQSGLVSTINPSDLAEWIADDNHHPLILDVRDQDEILETGMIPQARWIPLNDLRKHVPSLPKDSPIVLYCRSGHRSYVAARILRQHAFRQVFNLNGGMTAWQQHEPIAKA
ncbi:MAG: CoA-disulfide reductase [Sulfobacillus benefaciens]|uniref:CoA-disulfide reductase n=1 Tax=Sulfobacillus benefaciens TaxID=453960 RepID=A0A2T2XF08_9FIRM|nr:MAG: CoA-disulfide reductase [Sulfobacillus benefaciens]